MALDEPGSSACFPAETPVASPDARCRAINRASRAPTAKECRAEAMQTSILLNSDLVEPQKPVAREAGTSQHLCTRVRCNLSPQPCPSEGRSVSRGAAN